jgi:hypothetical protein
MNKNPFSRFELLFWDFAIRALSFFRTARTQLSKNGQLAYSSDTASLGILIGIAGVAGLASGYLFYFLTAFLR